AGIHNRAALKRDHKSQDLHFPARTICRHFGAARNIRALFRAAREAEAMAFGGFGLSPAESLCCRLQHRAKARLFEIAKAKFQWVEFGGAREFIHVHLASEDIRGGGEAAIRALLQRAAAGARLGALARHVVWAANGRASRVVIELLPRS